MQTDSRGSHGDLTVRLPDLNFRIAQNFFGELQEVLRILWAFVGPHEGQSLLQPRVVAGHQIGFQQVPLLIPFQQVACAPRRVGCVDHSPAQLLLETVWGFSDVVEQPDESDCVLQLNRQTDLSCFLDCSF